MAEDRNPSEVGREPREGVFVRKRWAAPRVIESKTSQTQAGPVHTSQSPGSPDGSFS
jgi:hypothetical protein